MHVYCRDHWVYFVRLLTWDNCYLCRPIGIRHVRHLCQDLNDHFSFVVGFVEFLVLPLGSLLDLSAQSQKSLLSFSQYRQGFRLAYRQPCSEWAFWKQSKPFLHYDWHYLPRYLASKTERGQWQPFCPIKFKFRHPIRFSCFCPRCHHQDNAKWG